MHRWALAAAVWALAPFVALAQESATYAAPVETIDSGGAHAGFMEMGASAGGYSWIARSSAASSSIFGRERSTLTYTFHFDRGDANVLRGACRLRSEGVSAFGVEWNQHTTQLYACEVRDQQPAQYALEVALPAFASSGFSMGGMSMSASAAPDAAQQAILHARMVYNGVAYEAAPISFGPDNQFARRVVTGYVVSREGHPVGRIEFRGNSTNQGAITVPAADADGREAVLFMCLTLQAMPDLYASATRDQVMSH